MFLACLFFLIWFCIQDNLCLLVSFSSEIKQNGENLLKAK